jgi:hypothetical protein
MKALWLVAVGAVAVACGPSYGGQGAKTPEEQIAEQERLADEQAEESKKHEYTGEVGETDLEKKNKWDKKQADLELKRAERSAVTCPAASIEESPAGTATVTLKFANDGHVKESSISSPYDQNNVGKCVLNAMGKVIVPKYEGEEETVTWEIELEAAKAKKEEAPAKKKK